VDLYSFNMHAICKRSSFWQRSISSSRLLQ